MKKIVTQIPELTLVGITTRTNNAQIFASDSSTNKIAATVQKYFYNGLPNKIYCIHHSIELLLIVVAKNFFSLYDKRSGIIKQFNF